MGGDGGAYTNKKSSHEADRRGYGGGGNTKAEGMSTQTRRLAEQRRKWSTCAASGQMLWPPLVGDKKGNIYRKDVVVKELIKRKSDAPPTEGVNLPADIKKMKHVKQLVFKSPALERLGIPAGVDGASAQGVEEPVVGWGEEEMSDLFKCPLSGDYPLTRPNDFLFCWECGHVQSRTGTKAMLKVALDVAQADAAKDEATSGANKSTAEMKLKCCWPGCCEGMTPIAMNPIEGDQGNTNIAVDRQKRPRDE